MTPTIGIFRPSTRRATEISVPSPAEDDDQIHQPRDFLARVTVDLADLFSQTVFQQDFDAVAPKTPADIDGDAFRIGMIFFCVNSDFFQHQPTLITGIEQ